MLRKKYPNKLRQHREGENVRRYNADKPPITQETLAKQCGVTRQTIAAIEAQEQMPSYPLALRIWSVFKHRCKILEMFPIPPINSTIDQSA
ncbi:MAG: helix-turn-helix domain-containing protein [Bdellovibrionales bacterium]|nr:helix-turn-helix domain-containing protein [Bdellovibrionales bacterium]